MPIEFRDSAMPDEIAATYGETSTSALDDHVKREDIFGPDPSAIAHDMADEAASVADDIAFGLTSCLHFECTGFVDRLAAESDMLHVNTSNVPGIRLPLAGIKGSPVGACGSNGPSTIQFP